MTIFDDIYRYNRWNGVESLSGPGSGPDATRIVRDEIVSLADRLGVTSVLDVACGDGYWMPDLPGYVGVDIAARAVVRARRRHPGRRYRVGDVRSLKLPAFDLIICRDVIQHHTLADGVAILGAIRATGSRWLLASTYIHGANVDITTGDCYSPDLTAEPFGLPWPAETIFDGYHYHPTDEARDPSKHLGLWSLTT